MNVLFPFLPKTPAVLLFKNPLIHQLRTFNDSATLQRRDRSPNLMSAHLFFFPFFFSSRGLLLGIKKLLSGHSFSHLPPPRIAAFFPPPSFFSPPLKGKLTTLSANMPLKELCYSAFSPIHGGSLPSFVPASANRARFPRAPARRGFSNHPFSPHLFDPEPRTPTARMLPET